MFEDYYDLKSKAKTYFNLNVHEIKHIIFSYEYDKTTIYIQDDEDVKNINEIFKIMAVLEIKFQHLITSEINSIEIDVEINKKKYQYIFAEKLIQSIRERLN